ncbi:membrane protein [Clostridium carboxidivorans P7]|uniref:Integral membrane protein TerC n=1 Tax=Clostridium carboxidivorans P7 TaxID=536227 RepID=C6PMW9_9CLOT|nr:TerC family protein [Clostridium carboxidivorans]AKN29804.1 membrane protein [Clostridium carboxidivorans P7]EET89547.1 Integral membrane protein TerC [Clostridium carboxidivorans P7]
MDNLITCIIGAFQITLLDIVLSGDNIGVIALATKDLPEKYAKKASAIGVFAAVLLRIVFTCFMTYILLIEWLPIKLVGGILLTKITWNFIKPNNENENARISPSNKFIGAIWSIIIADATMSLDNVLAIAGAADGNIVLVIFGLLLNIPIIFWGSQYVSRLMKRYPIVTYIGGAILAHTAFKMILEDKLISFIPNVFGVIIPNAAAILTIIYGLYIIKKPVQIH